MDKTQIRAIKHFSAFTLRYHWGEIIRGAYATPSIQSLESKIRPHILATLPASATPKEVESFTHEAATLARTEIQKALQKTVQKLNTFKAEINDFSTFTLQFRWHEIFCGPDKTPIIDCIKPKIRSYVRSTLPPSATPQDVESITQEIAVLARIEIIKQLKKIELRLRALKTEVIASMTATPTP